MQKSSTDTEAKRRFATFEDFWRYYLAEHSRPETRTMHVIGTTAGILGVAAWLKTGRAKYLAAGLAGSYGSAWLGHLAYERNMPAAFGNPLWSLQADLRMYRLWLTGELDNEVRRVLGTSGAEPGRRFVVAE